VTASFWLIASPGVRSAAIPCWKSSSDSRAKNESARKADLRIRCPAATGGRNRSAPAVPGRNVRYDVRVRPKGGARKHRPSVSSMAVNYAADAAR
jgi:hypothetical protein